MKKVIVTGASGFIGRWLVKELINNKIQVTAIVRNKSKLAKEMLDNTFVTIIEKDLLDVNAEDLDGEYECFYNLAWGGVRPQDKNDSELQISNIKLAIHALEVASNINVKKFIGIGTVAEYVFCKDILDVNAKQTPNDMYGAAKTATHYFSEVRARQLNMNFIWAILPSTFGEYRKDNNIITYTIKTLLKKETPEFGNLNQMWDFLYVSDVARALRLIGEKGVPSKIYGIGSGIYSPLKEYIIEIRDLIDPELELGIGLKPELSAQTFSSCVNNLELCRDTGFRQIIGFEEGIKKTIKYWERELQIPQIIN